MQFTRTRLATMGLFFIFGFISASWGIHIPTVKEKFNLNAAQLSIVFFAVAIGSITALTYLGGWIARVGNRTACTVGGVITCASAGGILLAPSFITLIVLLALFGIGVATLDVSINAQSNVLEEARGKPVISSMHCLHSIGGFAGATGGGMVLAHGINPSMHFISVALAGLMIVFLCRPALTGKQLGTYDDSKKLEMANIKTAGNGYKHVSVWKLGGITFLALLMESAIYDWIVVYMRENVQAGPALSSGGYAAYLAGVASGRFLGDAWRARIGSTSLFAVSGWVACIAFAAGLLFVSPSLTLISFAIAGLGFANIYPILLLTAARIKGIHAAQGIASVARVGYAGLLIGPVVIGGVAQISSLPVGLALIPLCAAFIAFIGPRTIRNILK